MSSACLLTGFAVDMDGVALGGGSLSISAIGRHLTTATSYWGAAITLPTDYYAPLVVATDTSCFFFQLCLEDTSAIILDLPPPRKKAS
jgi:hypothetical protein